MPRSALRRTAPGSRIIETTDTADTRKAGEVDGTVRGETVTLGPDAKAAPKADTKPKE